MADLQALVEDLGYRDVRTVLNSGNVVFTVPGKATGSAGARIERAIEKRLPRVTVPDFDYTKRHERPPDHHRPFRPVGRPFRPGGPRHRGHQGWPGGQGRQRRP